MQGPIAHPWLKLVDQQHMGTPQPDGHTADVETSGGQSLTELDLAAATSEPVFDALAALAAHLCHTTMGLVTVLDGQWALGVHGLTRAEVGPLQAFGSPAQGRSTVLSDARTDAYFGAHPLVTDAPNVRLVASCPIYSPAGVALGAVWVLDSAVGELSSNQLQALQAVAVAAAPTLASLGEPSHSPADDRYETLLDNCAAGALVLDGMTVVFANAAAARMLGEPSPTDLIGADLAVRNLDEQPLSLPAAGQRAFWRLRRADASELDAEVHQSSVIWRGRRAVQVEMLDVTEAVTAFSELAASESRYRQLADNSSDMITMQAEDGRYLYVSMGCRALTGYTPIEIMQQGHLDLVHPDDLVGFLDCHIQARTAGVDHFTATYRMRHSDGGWVAVESIVRLIRDEFAAVVEFQANTRDITERSLIERSRELADRRFRVAMDNAPIGMGLVSLDGTLTEVNRSLCELFDRTEPALIGGSLESMTHPDDAGPAAAQFARLLSGQNDSLELELRYRRTGGDYVWALRTASVVRDSEGEASYLVVQIQDITAWKTVEETLSRQALSDPLTGLANRLMLTQRLTHALVAAKRRRCTVGLVFIDLDRFKAINDSLGHEAGDSILKQVAERLNRSIREEDTAVRLGGDEFVVLCEDLGGMPDLRLVAARIDKALSSPYRIGDREVRMTASIGLSVAQDDDADSLLRHSDAAMYEAKRRGRGRTQVYDEGDRSDGLDSFTIEEELSRALEFGQLRLFYQPVVNILDGRTIAHEALVRWQHPVRGLLGPVEFLDIAEDGPLISELGKWVLQQACHDTALTANTDIGVNVSARQLSEPGFAQFVAETLVASGLAPQRLILEITETSILHATPEVLAATHAITSLGVRFALDDFGTGQSSLSSLQKLPISFLKIDRSFTSQIGESPATERLITGILKLAASTGLSVVAEGVEEIAQAEFLRAQGCTDAQGYLYGRPEPLRC